MGKIANDISKIGPGDIIKRDGKEFRVIYSGIDYLVLCELGIDYLDCHYEPTVKLLNLLNDGDISVVSEPEYIVDPEELSPNAKHQFEIRKEIARRLTAEFGPTFVDANRRGARKPIFNELSDEFGVSVKALQRLLTKYVQSGLRDYALLYHKRGKEEGKRFSEKKLGRPPKDEQGIPITPEVLKQFDEAIHYYETKKECSSWEDAYWDYLIAKYYTKTVIDEYGRASLVQLPPSERPTIRQFTYYGAEKVSKKDAQIIKTSEMEYKNDFRLLTGSSETGVYAPFDLVEMDAVEFDVSLVDVDHYYLTVGRPIIYLMKDVLTRMIVAASIGFDNNSNVGCISCFANLNEDKINLFAEYGIIVDNELYWVTGYKPRKLRFDNGSDFISKQVGAICQTLDIQRDIVSPGTGSYKGVIERSFHDAHQKLNKHFVGIGHIYEGPNPTYHKDATLTIHEFIKMFFNYIILYNTSPNSGIQLSKDMTEKGVLPIPAMIMKYYLGLSSPDLLPKGDSFLMALLNRGTARISRDGLTFKNLNFLNKDDEDLNELMEKAGTKRVPFKILYDPRSINMIYYVKDNKLERAKLNTLYKQQRTYFGMTFQEVEKMQERQKELYKEAKESSIGTRLGINESNKEVVTSAKSRKKKVKSSTKNMKENREKAKQKRSRELALEGRIGPEAEKPSTSEMVENNTVPAISESSGSSFIDPRTMTPEEYLQHLAEQNFKEDE